jgi:hypothetical protein
MTCFWLQPEAMKKQIATENTEAQKKNEDVK